ncbi:hypothetical protein Tco_1201374 [Tanacetum coccineum]
MEVFYSYYYSMLSAKSNAWNELSSSMASLIICLATNQKFNLSKYIFDAMVKHLDGGVKFLLYPHFLQVFINQQLGNMSTHKKIFVNHFHTKKVFASMKRAGKDFSGRITPLFDTMMKDKSSKKAQRQEAEVPQHEAEHEESVPKPSNDPQPSGEDSMQLTELMVLCTKLQTQVLDLQRANDAQAKEIDALKKRIQRLERRKMSRPKGLKRLSKVGMSRRVESSEDQESLGVPEDASKQGRSIEDIDADVDVSLVDETQERQDDDLIFDSGVLEVDVMHVEAKVDGKDEQSKKPDDSTAGEAVTTASIDDSAVPTTNEEITLAQTLIQIKAAKPKVVTTAATTATTTRPKDKGVVVQEPSEFRVPQEIKPSSSKDKGKVKTRKEGEVERKPAIRSFCVKWNEDIAIDAIPLATKLSVIVDYKLHKEGMLVHYQLIRADGSSKRYSSMIRMLQGIDREIGTLFEMIVKAKYGDTRPENGFERVLYGDLKVMFKPDIKSDVWRMLEGYREIPPHTNYNLHIAQQKLQMIIKIDVLSTAEVMVKQQKGK